MKNLLTALVLLGMFPINAFANIASKLNGLTGFTIIGSKTITGWYDQNKEKKGDSFEGCEFGRVIIFDNDKALACSSYSYHYAYRPTAVILSKNGIFKMIVDDELYDMTSIF